MVPIKSLYYLSLLQNMQLPSPWTLPCWQQLRRGKQMLWQPWRMWWAWRQEVLRILRLVATLCG